MIHGGDTLSFKDSYKGELVDFSSNINPLGLPPGLEEELINGFSSLTAYPDIHYRKLKKSLAQYLKCESKNILVGNGAVEIIDNFIINASRVLIFRPSFAEYELRALVHKKEVEFISYNKDFEINLWEVKEKIRADDLLILGNPNNPTGLRIERETLLSLYEIVRKVGAYLLLDEAFYEFCPEDYDSIQIFKDKAYDAVGIIRAATKFFSLPGIRLGYGCASIKKVEEIKKLELPWSVNSLGDIAGQFIFKDKEFIEMSKAYIEKERKFLLENLEKIEGIHAYKTHTNYILIKLEKWDEDYFFEYFLKRGIVIRKCSSFTGLDKNHIRIAIKDRQNNKKLIKIFQDISKANS